MSRDGEIGRRSGLKIRRGQKPCGGSIPPPGTSFLLKLPTAEHALAAYTAYLAYFGTYTIDVKKHVVTHHVEGGLSPDYIDTEQPRPFLLKGDRLEIGDGKTWRRLLERVRRSHLVVHRDWR